MQPGTRTYAPSRVASTRSSSTPPGAPASGGGSLIPTAPVTFVLIAANVAVFVAQVVAAGNVMAAWTMSPEVMRAFGANLSSATIWEHQWESTVTSCFLHFSVLHLGFNMIALRQAGPIVERAVGAGRFAPMYVASGAIGSLLSAGVGVLRHTPVLSAGASGAICGVIGAAMVIGARTQGWRGPLTRSMAQWLGMIVVIGFALPGIDPYAHAGGAVTGAVIASAWRRNVVYGPVARWLGILGALAVCVVAAARVVARDATDPYASLTVDERAQLAIEALSAGHCDEARRAIAAAAKSAPTAQPIKDLQRSIAAHCDE